MILRTRLVTVSFALIFIFLTTALFQAHSSIPDHVAGDRYHPDFKPEDENSASAEEPRKATNQKPAPAQSDSLDPTFPLPRPPLGSPSLSSCPGHLEWLEELAASPDVTFPLKYARREIIVREKAGVERLSVTRLNEELLPAFQEISSPDDRLRPENCLSPLELDVPIWKRRIDASHILFGATTTLERLDASIPFFQRWLADTGARFLVIIRENEGAAPDPQAIADLQARMRDLGINIMLVEPADRKADHVIQYFSLIRLLWKNKDSNTQWFGFIDDDTFFVSLSTLLSRLADYDPSKEWYLGAVSEEWWTVQHYGWIAMGGGGIFLSAPLLSILERNYDKCLRKAHRKFGDHRISECISRTTPTRLTHLDGLYQIDLHGDRSGVFESGRGIISQHHWKEGYWSETGAGADNIRHSRWFPMDKMSLITDLCGDSCFLQRWAFGSHTLLTNGYSLATFPYHNLSTSSEKEKEGIELWKTEQTWTTPSNVEKQRYETSGYDHYLGPLRSALKLDREKLHYRFMDAVVLDERKAVRQYYRRLGMGKRKDELVELVWRTGNGTKS